MDTATLTLGGVLLLFTVANALIQFGDRLWGKGKGAKPTTEQALQCRFDHDSIGTQVKALVESTRQMNIAQTRLCEAMEVATRIHESHHQEVMRGLDRIDAKNR